MPELQLGPTEPPRRLADAFKSRLSDTIATFLYPALVGVVENSKRAVQRVVLDESENAKPSF